MSELISLLFICMAPSAFAQEIPLQKVLFASSKDRFLIEGLQVPNPKGLQGAS
jgi:hypothetical protein